MNAAACQLVALCAAVGGLTGILWLAHHPAPHREVPEPRSHVRIHPLHGHPGRCTTYGVTDIEETS